MISRPDFEAKQIMFYFPAEGEKLAYKNDNLVIKSKDDKIKYQISCYRVFAIFVVGDLSITTPLIRRANKFNFTISLFTLNFKLYAVLGKRTVGNTVLNRKQYAYDGIYIAKSIVRNKIENQLKVIKSIRSIDTKISRNAIERLTFLSMSIDSKTNLDGIRGVEGNAAKLYFDAMYNEFGWERRLPRIKHDYINSCLDIGYSFLFNFVDALLQNFGFDVYVGVMHTEFYMRKSLVCDLMEPIRPLVDRQIRKCLRLNQFSKEDFIVINHQYQLGHKNMPKYVKLLMEPLLDKKNEIYVFIRQFYRQIMKNSKTYEQFQ